MYFDLERCNGSKDLLAILNWCFVEPFGFSLAVATTWLSSVIQGIVKEIVPSPVQ